MLSQRSGTTQRIIEVRSLKGTHFTGEITQNNFEHENIAIPHPPLVNQFIINHIAILSEEKREWDVFFWHKDTQESTDLDVDTFIDFVNFPEADDRLGNTPVLPYYYAASGLNIPYKDKDVTKEKTTASELHLSLVNRSAGAKTAGAAGEVVVIVKMTPSWIV